MPRPWNLAPPRARRASGAHLLAPPPRVPAQLLLPAFSPRGPSPPVAAPGGPGAGSEEAAGPRSSWVQGRAGGLLATGRAHPAVFRESAAREEARDGEGASGARRQRVAP